MAYRCTSQNLHRNRSARWSSGAAAVPMAEVGIPLEEGGVRQHRRGGRWLKKDAGQEDSKAERGRPCVNAVGSFEPPADLFDPRLATVVVPPPARRMELVAVVLEPEPPRDPGEVDLGDEAPS